MNKIFFIAVVLCTSIIHANNLQRAEIVDRNGIVLAHSNMNSQRHYPFGTQTTSILGYVLSKNNLGKTGLEKQYNAVLNQGNRLQTTIDIQLQVFLYELFGDLSGAVIIMNANNGEIVAAGSFPTYDANIFLDGMQRKDFLRLYNDKRKPFRNRLINALYPPGSIIKSGLGLLYITTEVSSYWSVDCNASLPLGKRMFRCEEKQGHGKTEIIKAIRENCDDYFYKGSFKLGIKKMSEGLKRYGLGEKTGVDLPKEFKGLVPSSEWKKEKYNQPWYIGETLNTSIGQGNFLVTPMQMAQYTALMATGKLITPHFASDFKPIVKEVLHQKELKKLPIIQKAMYEVCNHPRGTATQYLSSNVEIAGKTGQAQAHSWFTAYGPYINPQYVVTVIVENSGNDILKTAEIVSEIYNKLIELDYIKNGS